MSKSNLNHRSPAPQGDDLARPANRPFVVEPYHRNIPEAMLLEDIRRVAAQLHRKALPASLYDDHGRFSSITIGKRFGSWTAALARVGLEPAHFFNVTPAMLRRDLRRVARKVKSNRLRCVEYKALGKYSLKVIRKIFKTWQAAANAAGLAPMRYRPANQEELFDNLQHIWQTLGRQPLQVDIAPPLSKFSIRCYINRFGTFRKALCAFEQFKAPPGTVVQTYSFPRGITGRKTSRAINWRMRYMILHRDHFRCVACGRSPVTHQNVDLQVDHKIPWSKGGETVMENLQTLCQMCNGGKSNVYENSKNETSGTEIRRTKSRIPETMTSGTKIRRTKFEFPKQG